MSCNNITYNFLEKYTSLHKYKKNMVV